MRRKLITAALLVSTAFSLPVFAANDNNLPVLKNVSMEIPSDSQISKKLFATVNVGANVKARKYILAPNDVFDVTVMGDKDLSATGVRVQPDGKINLLYLDNLNVTGMTIDQLQELITKKYSEYLVNPQISITLSQARPFIVYVSGGIYNPGAYELNTVTNSTPYYSQPGAFVERKTPLLSNVIVAAGGVTYDADVEHIKIENSIDGSTMDVNAYDIVKNADSSQDIYLMSGDKIIIPKLPTPLAVNEQHYKELAKSTFFQKQVPVRVIGYVNNPGLVQLTSNDSISLNSAIAAAGGYTSASAYPPKKVYISRVDGTKLVTYVVDPRHTDSIIMPNDVIYVPDKVRPVAGRFFDYLVRMLAPAYSFTNIYYDWDYISR